MAFTFQEMLAQANKMEEENKRKILLGQRTVDHAVAAALATTRANNKKLGGLDATWDRTKEGLRSGGVGMVNTVKSAVANKNQGYADNLDSLSRINGFSKPVVNPYRERQQAIMDDMVRSALDMSKRSAVLDEKYAHLPARTQWLSKAVGGTAQMIPAVAAGLVGGPAVGMVAFGGQVSGNSAAQALAQGATLDKATEYAAAETAKEMAIERMFGFMPGLGKGVINPNGLIEKGIKSNIGQLAAKTGVGAVGEGIEEGVAQVVTPFLQRAIYDPEADNASLLEVADAFGQGAVGGLLLGGAGNVANYAQNRRALNASSVQEQQQQTSLDQQAPVDRAVVPNEQQAPAGEGHRASQGQTADVVGRVQNHIDNRDSSMVRDKNVKAFQYENEQVKPFYQEQAKILLADLDSGIKGERFAMRDDEGNLLGVNGQQRVNSDPVVAMLNDGMNYEQIRAGLNRIITDSGRENQVTAKRVELYLDEALSNGYDSMSGRIDPNFEYLDVKSGIDGAQPNLLYPSMDHIQGVQGGNSRGSQEQPAMGRIVTDRGNVIDVDTGKLDQSAINFISQVSSKTKLNYRIVNGLPDHVNAFLENGTIVYNVNKLDKFETVRYVTAHEVYHSMGGNLEHAQIGNLALEYLAGLQNQKRSNDTDSWIIQKKMDEYQSMGKQLNGNEAVDEIGAEFMEVALMDERVANYILTKNPNVFQKVWHYITDQISYFTKKATLGKAERAQLKILRDAQRLYARGIKGIDLEQTNSMRFSINPDFVKQIDNWDISKTGGYFYLGEASKPLVDVGIPEGPIYIDRKKIASSVIKRHGLDKASIKQLPQMLDNPTLILFSKTQPNSIVVFGDMFDGEGRPVMAAIRIGLSGGQRSITDVTKVTSLYGRNNAKRFIMDSELMYLDSNKKRTDDWLRLGGFTSKEVEILRLQLPTEGVNTSGSTKTISHIPEDVNGGYSFGENTGGMADNALQKLATLLDGDEGNQFSLDQANEEKTPYERLVEKYGAIDPGENPARDVQVPKFIDKNRKTSQWTRTAMEAKPVDEETVRLIQKDMAEDLSSKDFSYEIETDVDALNKANIVIDFEGYENAARAWQAKFASGLRMKKADMVLGERLIQEAIDKNDYSTALKLISDVAALGSEMGQSVQALRMLKKLTPEGLLMGMERTILRINRQLLENGGAPVRLSKVARERILGAKSQDELDVAINMAYLELGEQMPATLSDKIIAWRYMSMLANPRTHIRNFLSNAVMAPVQYVKDVVGTGLENMFLSKDERTKSLYASKELRDFARENFAHEAREMLAASGSKYSDPMGRIRDGRQIFKPKLLEGVRVASSTSLEWEDMLFKKPAYISSFARFAQARGWSVEYLSNNKAARNEAQQYALLEARKATFQETSDLANALNHFERTNVTTKLLVGSAMPFKRTPINILKRGFEYSLLGVLNGLKKISLDVKDGKCSKAEAMDSIAAGMTGVMIMTLGYFLASMGWATAGSDEERRKENHDRLMGEQDYAINIPGSGTYTIDWLSPSAMPLLVGVELHNQLSNGGEEPPFPRIIHAFTKIADPVLEMSMLSGLSNILRTYQNDTSAKFSDYAYNVTSGYLGQFVPTFAGQVARTIDDTKRSTYAPKDSPYTKGGEQFIRRTMNKIPIASQYMEPSIDMWGREVQQSGSGSGNEWVDMATRAALNMVSPGIYKPNAATPLDKKLSALYEATGESGVLPKYPEKTITYDEQNYYLSAKDYTDFSKGVGQANYRDIEKFTGSSYFQEMHGDQQAKVIANLYEYNTSDAKYGYLKRQGIDYSNSSYAKAREAIDAGVKPYEYFAIKSFFSGDDFDKAREKYDTCKRLELDVGVYKSVSKDLYNIRADKNSNGKSITNSRKKKVYAYLNNSAMTAKQKQYFWKHEYPGKK